MPRAIKDCPFCNLDPDRVLWSDDNVVVVRDGYPVTPGHLLVIPRRHVGSFFEATHPERESITRGLDEAKWRVESEQSPSGYNIGINDGEAAGQTILHLHVHLIPRYEGDCADPRGGVRWVLSETARYW